MSSRSIPGARPTHWRREEVAEEEAAAEEAAEVTIAMHEGVVMLYSTDHMTYHMTKEHEYS